LENDGMIITQPRNELGQREPLQIIMKSCFSDETLYHCIIQILEWSKATNGNDIQRVFDWLKEKNFVQEHIYNPIV
jgi:hypothetical protein